jgi:hypothetical protein
MLLIFLNNDFSTTTRSSRPRKFARDRARIQLFPVLVQNQPKNASTGQRVAAHTSGDASLPGFVFPMTGLTTVMPSPASNNKRREAFRFASIASHNLPCRERFAKRFSEGVFEIQRRCFSMP